VAEKNDPFAVIIFWEAFNAMCRLNGEFRHLVAEQGHCILNVIHGLSGFRFNDISLASIEYYLSCSDSIRLIIQ
jgi:hypothetical protein